MKKVDIDKYTYHIEWSEELNAHIATCLEFPLLSAEGKSSELALKEVKKLITKRVEWIIDKKQKLPKLQKTIKKNKTNSNLSEVEYIDFLTGLYNRNYCQKVFKNYAKLETPFSFVYFDIDGFKAVNDTLNHEVGDKILQVVSNSLTDVLGDDVYLFRLGGDEFACVVSDEISAITTTECIDKILSIFNETIYLETVYIDLTISLGVVYYPKNISNVKDIFKVAEIVVQEAKKNRENSICFFEKELKNKMEAKVLMESCLSVALRKNELFLVYQPIIQLNDEDSIVFEALLRWHSTDLGFVSPAEFIPLAESMGQICSIGLWVIEKAMEKLAYLKTQSSKNVMVSINISVLQITEANFVNNVKQLIEKHNISPNSLIFEFTESIFIENSELNKEILKNIRNLGVYIAIDDFGTGYSSLTYLKDMDINCLKIDKTFVDELGKSDKSNALVEAIINVGHKLNMDITAEGIETKEQLDILKAFGCDSIQGYYYSKPLPEDQLDKYL